ncbi:MAG: [Oscillospiraceae bacterium]|nr:[FeFe] hydrogenase, group A [Oscillospiraceae bacterium]
MVNLKIDGKSVAVPEGSTILEAARQAGVNIPTLCYLKDVNEISACRVCCVEVAGSEKLVPSCSTPAVEGMEVFTHTTRVLQARVTNVSLILSQHNSTCTACTRSGNCALQSLASDITYTPAYEVSPRKMDWDTHYPLIRDNSRCINCMRCVSVCEKIQTMRVWDVSGTGARTHVGVREGLDLMDTNCTLCGQCITHCPVGALYSRDDAVKLVRRLGNRHDKVFICQVAPAVRTAWGEDLGLSPEQATVGRMAAALRAIGFDYVFDTDFSADLTIMEEGSEFLERLSHKEDYPWPMFTSCCPGWLRFIKTEFPELVPNLSTAKSPQQMFGATAKSYFAEKIGRDPEDIVCVSFMPCTAKKYECAVEAVNDAATRDVDMVLTTRELAKMLRNFRINVAELPEEDFDDPLGESTGAGVIFGTTGGVMEAALRSAYYLATGSNPDPDAFHAVRGMEGIKAATFDIEGTKVRTAVANGLGNARKLVEAIKAGKAEYDFVEIMACPTGCSGGGGQPIRDGQELGERRGSILRRLDVEKPIRFSHDNPSIQKLYSEYLEKPLSHRAHKLLHTDVSQWSLK